jgi:hypothetical protein
VLITSHYVGATDTVLQKSFERLGAPGSLLDCMASGV